MKKFNFILFLLISILFPIISFMGCSDKKISMYNIETKTIEKLDLEEYIAGVVAGEMYSSWPEEALKAQCVLARTFTMDFLENKTSKYNGADISNDISEAQAYNSNLITDKIRKAVNDTKGQVIKSNNEYINAWFHSNSGGVTEKATIGLNYSDNEPDYIKSINSPENDSNSQNYNWEYTFSKSEILKALNSVGLSVNTISTIKLGELSNTGRAITLLIGDKYINTNTFRLAIGTTKLKSTLIKQISVSTDSVTFKGNGYGHGVGLSQWGAKILADQGKDYKYIINYYFENIQIVKI